MAGAGNWELSRSATEGEDRIDFWVQGFTPPVAMQTHSHQILTAPFTHTHRHQKPNCRTKTLPHCPSTFRNPGGSDFHQGCDYHAWGFQAGSDVKVLQPPKLYRRRLNAVLPIRLIAAAALAAAPSSSTDFSSLNWRVSTAGIPNAWHCLQKPPPKKNALNPN